MLYVPAVALLSAVSAQVSAPGQPLIGKPIEVVTLTDLSLDAVDAEAAARAAPKDQVGGRKFGLDQILNVTAYGAGQWSPAADGNWVWRYTIQSPKANAIMPVFDAWVMPEGASFFAYSDSETVGAFTSANNKPNGEFVIWPVKGDTLTLEYNGPKTAAMRLSIQKVIHVFHGFGTCFGCSESCNVNVNCEQGEEWVKQSAGVAILMSSQSRGFCTGSMINSVSGDPLFLTAAHCQPSSSDIIGFKWESPTCADPSSAPSFNSAQGLDSLASSSPSDFHILKVRETIPASWGVYLNGWDATVAGPGTQLYDDVHGIHHPAADLKKISRSDDGATTSTYLGSGDGDTHWWVRTWEKGSSPTEFAFGTTEGGSSGSPLFSEDKLIIGQLHGGYASCGYNYDDYYGAVMKSMGAGLAVHLRGSDSSITKMNGADWGTRLAEKQQ